MSLYWTRRVVEQQRTSFVMLVGGSLSQAAPAGPATNAIHIMQLFQSGSCTLTEDNLAANTVTLWRYIMETRTRERRTVSSKMKSEGEGVREQRRESLFGIWSATFKTALGLTAARKQPFPAGCRELFRSLYEPHTSTRRKGTY